MSSEYRLHSSIPVLRMLDEERSRSFYVNFLGYEIEWSHRFQPDDPESPLYLQVRQGESVLHLNGHADERSPIVEVRIPVENLETYCQWLRQKCPEGVEPPEIVDPRHEGRNSDMNILDPAGNLLVFWTPSSLVSSGG